MNAASLFVQPKATGAGGPVRQYGNDNSPELSAIMENLQYHFSDYKYTVYRCAAKVVALQKALHTVRIPYKFVLAVLERHGHRAQDPATLISPFHLTAFVRDLFAACEKLGHFSEAQNYQIEVATSVLTNFFWNVFDPLRRYSVSLLELKVSFILLCKIDATEELGMEFYELLCNKATKCVPKRHFEKLLSALTKFCTYLGEGNAYGICNTDLVLEQTFERCHNASGFTEYQFHALWSSTHTRFLIYANLLALIKRLEETEKLVHDNACAACSSERIIGIRFKCQACKSLSLCLKCFATGYATNKHEAGHRMYEVFVEDAPPKKFTHYFAKLCQLLMFNCNVSGRQHNDETKEFCRSQENASATFMETEMVTITREQARTENSRSMTVEANGQNAEGKNKSQNETNTRQMNEIKNSIAGLSAATTNAQHISQRLQLVINRLLQHNAQVEHQLTLVKTATRDELIGFLTAHEQFMVAIIKDMRIMAETQATSSSSCQLPLVKSSSCHPLASTPFRPFTDKDSKLPNSSMLSSVVPLPPPPSDGNLTHSIYGADINRSYLEANRSDYSLSELSFWFSKDPRRQSLPFAKQLDILREEAAARGSLHEETMRETDITNFRLLLGQVKELLEMSYGDNGELTEATQNLENVLDSIITKEESRSRSSA